MDAVTLGYYALICGALAVASPRLRTPPLRFLVGVAVGLLAAGLLPYLRRTLGGD